ncbi:hypothetical protein [Hymenobacter canadensis]|uniref:Uncharacterized protein n=1 Tax=Hymenobacter canadensis TaxID=2999067 RepID=A0ABY7LMQ7_9BACT|nr:hypothetical protein [Hymenobacter canadensis]WBA41732.1 hypothetical protein O3303_18215 [Hymenobacter canadensis]
MQKVQFDEPVEVYVRLDKPVKGAEYRLIMERKLVPQLDTMTFTRMLHHPGIFFSKIFTNSVSGKPVRKYYMDRPENRGSGLYPFDTTTLPANTLVKPYTGVFYTRKEPAKNYSYWLVRKNSSDMGINDKVNTLPGVDSVRVVYVIKTRARWKRGHNNNAAK